MNMCHSISVFVDIWHCKHAYLKWITRAKWEMGHGEGKMRTDEESTTDFYNETVSIRDAKEHERRTNHQHRKCMAWPKLLHHLTFAIYRMKWCFYVIWLHLTPADLVAFIHLQSLNRNPNSQNYTNIYRYFRKFIIKWMLAVSGISYRVEETWCQC